MNDLPEFDLEKSEAEAPAPHPPPRPSLLPWLAAAALLVGALIAGYFILNTQRPSSAPDSAGARTSTDASVARPLGGGGDPIDVPPLDESDAIVRRLVSALSSHPRVAAWLSTTGLIRNFAATVENIAGGSTPAPNLRPLRPSASFAVVTRDDALVIDERSYGRYDDIADAVGSLDAAGCSRLYATLKPRIEEAYRDLGSPDGSFDRALERAIVKLLQTPVIESPIAVEPSGIAYAFADPDLEALAPAQKHLIRMGPRNVRLVRTKLREIALALGIPDERLPQSR